MVLPLLLLAALLVPQEEPFGKKTAKPEAKILAARPSKEAVKAGEAFTLVFEIEITPGWHIYPTAKTTTGEPTQLAFEAAELSGKIEEEPKAKVHPAADGEPAYEYQEGKVAFRVPLRLKPGPKPGPFELKGSFKYMICNAETCLPLKTVPFGVALTVLEGQGVAPTPASGPSESFLVMLGFAFLGGLILNIMPCVLPVLMIKLNSLVKQKDAAAGVRQGAAISYTLGVLLCLNCFAAVVIVLRSLGKLVGWGFQFQEPAFVIALATVIFVFALSLLGVFHLPALATGAAAQAGRRHGWAGHLLTGFFVTLVATPCSAPLLGTAMGYAFTLPSWGIVVFFSAVGLGLAFPFLAIGFFPVLFRILPKPGAWVEAFERIMGFILIATVVWLVDTIGTLTGKAGVTGMLAFLTAVSLGAWIYGHWGAEVASPRARLVSLGIAVLLSVVGGKVFLVTEIAQASDGAAVFRMEGLDYARRIPWQPFSEENVSAVRKARKPGFIDFTADW